MKNAVLFACALLVGAAAIATPSFAASGSEPAASATEPMKAKTVKHHKQRHSLNLKAHRTHKAA